MPGAGDAAPQSEGSVTQLPGFLHAPFAAAMSQAMLLPAFVALLGVVAALFLLGFANAPLAAPLPADPPDDAGDHHDWNDGDFVDDDEYVEYVVHRDDPEPRPAAPARVAPQAVVDTDDPVAAPQPEKPSQEWRSILDQLMAEPTSRPESNGFPHNGLHVDARDTGSHRHREPGARGRHSRDTD